MDNNSTYKFYLDATTTAKAGKGNAVPNTSFSAYRMFAKTINAALRKDWEEKEKAKEDLKQTYITKVVMEKSAEMDKVYKDAVTGKKEVLSKVLDKLTANVRNAYEKFFLLPPDPLKVMRIEKAESRMDTMSETEWLLLIKDANNNYQETALLHSLAAKHGKDYTIPFEPEQAEKNLASMETLIREKVIPYIGEDPAEYVDMATYFNHEDGGTVYGQMNYYADYFDSIPIAVTDGNPIPELTSQKDINSRLIDARQKCWANNAKALWEEAVTAGINLQKKGLTEENITKAEKIISIVDELYPGEGNGENNG